MRLLSRRNYPYRLQGWLFRFFFPYFKDYIMSALTDLQASVDLNTAATVAVMAKIDSLKSVVPSDEAALAALKAVIDDSTAKLTAAVA